MATWDDVRRLALALPETSEGTSHGNAAWKVKDKGFVWVWLERIHPKKGRVPQPKVIAISVADLAEKEAMLASDSEVFFTEPHYNGYPAVMVRLEAVALDELEELIIDAWRCQAPAALVARYDLDHPLPG